MVAGGLAGASWQAAAPLPVPRSEVAATVVRGEIVVAGGFLSDGTSSREVDAFSPATGRWRRLADLPFGLNHAAAAAYAGRAYVLGGYRDHGGAQRREAYVLDAGRWRPLPKLPEARGAAGAAVIGKTLYVVGGVAPGGVPKRMLAFDLVKRRWSTLPGPTPREHLAVTSYGGRLYALGGRVGGYTNSFATFETAVPGKTWQPLAPVPTVRSGTGIAVLRGTIVSIGGETADGIVKDVYGYDVARGAWTRLPDLPTPRHGLGVVTLGGRVWAVGGGPEPGLTVSAANEALDLP